MSAPPSLEALARVERRVRCRWTPRDVVLYALGVGAGADRPCLTTDDTGLRVLPTFAATLSARALSSVDLGLGRPESLLHREQGICLWEALPTACEVEGRVRVSDAQRLGRGAVVEISADWCSTASGRRIFESVAALYIPGAQIRGAGRAVSKRRERPSREPDLRVACPTRPDQALVYRLSGDRNPLHSDPQAARRAGFDAPILHGLCTYGLAWLGILEGLRLEDPTCLRAMSTRFSKPVTPGETLELRIWEADSACDFEMRNRHGQVVLDFGRAELATTDSKRAQP